MCVPVRARVLVYARAVSRSVLELYIVEGANKQEPKTSHQKQL